MWRLHFLAGFNGMKGCLVSTGTAELTFSATLSQRLWRSHQFKWSLYTREFGVQSGEVADGRTSNAHEANLPTRNVSRLPEAPEAFPPPSFLFKIFAIKSGMTEGHWPARTCIPDGCLSPGDWHAAGCGLHQSHSPLLSNKQVTDSMTNTPTCEAISLHQPRGQDLSSLLPMQLLHRKREEKEKS